MDLVIGNKIIVTPIDVILHGIQRELTNGKLKDIGKESHNNIPVTCPYHKDGKERNPSCMVFTKTDDENVQYGFCHCWSCGYKKPLPEFINDCFDEEGDFGQEWLLERCETAFLSEVRYLPEIILDKKDCVQTQYMDEKDLDKYAYYHDYMWQRKLSKKVVDLFEVGYDKDQDMLVFPVRDDRGRLLWVTKRSVKTKKFLIPDDTKKPVYLLYYIKQHNIKRVAVMESQINALTAWSWGIPAIALFGTGSKKNYEDLKKSGIRVYDLYFDGDDAGRAGCQRFLKNMPEDVIINVYHLPEGKDVNDLSYEEFINLKPI